MKYKVGVEQGRGVSVGGVRFPVVLPEDFEGKPPHHIIYVIANQAKPIYVGQSGRGFHRCIRGLCASYGATDAYKWREDPDVRDSTLEIMVFGNCLPHDLICQKKQREIVEADVVFSIREKLGEWPGKLKRLNVNGIIKRSDAHVQAVDQIVRGLQAEKWI